jgi:ribosome-associated protein
MSGPVFVRGSIVIPAAELQWRFSRSSGPGGQHVNKTSSAAELLFDVAASPSIPEPYRSRALARLSTRLIDGVLAVRSEEHRSQWQNRQAAEARLAALLFDATAPEPSPRKATKPSRGMRERRLENKRRRSDVKRLRSRPDF